MTHRPSTRHAHGHGPHGHAHHHDRGPRGLLRYVRMLPRLWRSDLNDAVVRELAIRPGERVVDLGAGAGAATVRAADLGAEVIAVDPLPFMRSVLRLRGLLHPRGVVRVLHGAAEAIPAEDASVDALWTVNTLHHWTDRDAAIRELARILRPGARALLLDEDFFAPDHPEHERFAHRAPAFDFDAVDPQALAAGMERAGFAHAEGSRTRLAGRPVKLVRATR